MRKIFIMFIANFVALTCLGNPTVERVSFNNVERFNTVVVDAPSTIRFVEDSTYVVRMRCLNGGCNYEVKNDTLFIKSNQKRNVEELDHNKTRIVLHHPNPDQLRDQIMSSKKLLIKKNKSGYQN